MSLGVGKGSKPPGPLGVSGQAKEFWLLEKIHRHLHLLPASVLQCQLEKMQISKWACRCPDSEYPREGRSDGLATLLRKGWGDTEPLPSEFLLDPFFAAVHANLSKDRYCGWA